MKAKFALITGLVLSVLTTGCTSANAEVFGKNADRGALIGGVLGAIIGNNSGNHNGAEGAAIGAASGLILGAVADQNEHRARYPYEREVVYNHYERPVVYGHDYCPGEWVIVKRHYWVSGRLYIRHEREWRGHHNRYHHHRRY